MQDFLYDGMGGQKVSAAKPYQIFGRERSGNSDKSLGKMRDYEYFKSLYPAGIKGIQRYAEEVCDEMEYEGSPIFDEYPDRVIVDRMIRKAAARMPAEEMASSEMMKTAAVSERESREMETVSGHEMVSDMSAGEFSGAVRPAYGPMYGDSFFSGYTAWEPEETGMMKIQERCPWKEPGRRPVPPPMPPNRPVPPPMPPNRPAPPQGIAFPFPELDDGISVQDMLAVLLMNEIRERRCRNGRCG